MLLEEGIWEIYRACKTDQERLMVRLLCGAGWRVEDLRSITFSALEDEALEDGLA